MFLTVGRIGGACTDVTQEIMQVGKGPEHLVKSRVIKIYVYITLRVKDLIACKEQIVF